MGYLISKPLRRPSTPRPQPRLSQPSHRAPPTFNSVTASYAAAALGRTFSANAPHWPRYASATTSTSTGPSVASRRVRNVPWATTPLSPTSRRTGPTLDGAMDPGTTTPHPRRPRGIYPPSQLTDPGGHQHTGRQMCHTSGHSIKKHWRTTALGRRLSAPPTTMTLTRSPPYPLPQHISVTSAPGPPCHTHRTKMTDLSPASTPPPRYPPSTRLSRWPREPPRYRTGPGPPTPAHHTPPATSGTPDWGRTTAKQPTPPSCPGGQNPGLATPAQRGWATV